MNVFISWSGDLSQKLADAFRSWIPNALQAVRPYFTPDDIEKGARWYPEISGELESAEIGVLFVTRENISSPWLMYEAGALSKHLDKSRVCPVTFEMSHNDLPGPLRQLQATEFRKDDFKKLLKTVNASAGEHKLRDSNLDQVFEMWWPRLEDDFTRILDNEAVPEEEIPVRSDREILEEILDLSRLRAQQTSKGDLISPRAVVGLIDALEASVEAIQGKTNSRAALEALSQMRAPLNHLLRRHEGNIGNFDVLYERFKNLNYKYQAPRDDLDDLDDEIPF